MLLVRLFQSPARKILCMEVLGSLVVILVLLWSGFDLCGLWMRSRELQFCNNGDYKDDGLDHHNLRNLKLCVLVNVDCLYNLI